MPRDFFDPTSEQQNVILIEAVVWTYRLEYFCSACREYEWGGRRCLAQDSERVNDGPALMREHAAVRRLNGWRGRGAERMAGQSRPMQRSTMLSTNLY